MQEEIFAPVVVIMKIKTREEAIDLVNDCPLRPLRLHLDADYRKDRSG